MAYGRHSHQPSAVRLVAIRLAIPVLHRFAKLVAACTVLLILAGSLVTSHDAGLSVPDWPTSYGWSMFTFPPSMWVANISSGPAHRFMPGPVGFPTTILAACLCPPAPPRCLGCLARPGLPPPSRQAV